MAVSPIRIAARLEYATLEELEAGFAERLGERELFLAHGSFGSIPDEPRVGASVVVEIATASGETALALEGVIAWSYPPTLVPPGREAGTGISIDRYRDGSEARILRMRRRGGAGVRVRAPGSRLKAPAIERTRPEPIVVRPLPASLFETAAQRGAPPPSAAPWHAPTPRVMGLALDRSTAPTSTPRRAPLPLEVPDHAAPAPPTPAGSEAPAAVSLDALPDLPAALAAGAFEQVPTDVDLLRSADDARLVDGVSRGEAFDRRPLVDVAGPRVAPLAPPAEARPPPGDKTDWPPAPQGGEPEVVSDDDVSPVDEDSTGSHEVPISRLPSLDEADFETAEHQAVAPPTPSSSAAEWEARTEHGLDASEPTAEASDPDSTALPVRPLPVPPPWPAAEARSPRPIGVAFVVARRTHAPVGLEVLSWPAAGTKRVGALDEARAQGGEALDRAIASSQWLARDASADAAAAPAEGGAYFDSGRTDPGRRVVDVVGAAVQAAESEPDEGDVFSDRSERPASPPPNPALDEATVAEGVDERAPGALEDAATVATDDTLDGVLAAPPLLPDDEAETDRALRRPPTDASAATKSRLGVLQRFLGKR